MTKRRILPLHRTTAGALICLACTAVASPVAAEISDTDFAKAFEKYAKSAEGEKAIAMTVQNFFKKQQQGPSLDEQFENPLKLDVGSSPTMGPENAPVTIIEFSDFECPFCKRGADTVKEVVKEYPDKVRVAFKNLPLDFHKNAEPAAKAALAAGKQGKFWEMHDALFENQRTLTEDFFLKTAEKLGLDMDKFKADMKSPEIQKQIEEDKQLAQKAGIRGTPGFVINGVKLSGAQPLPRFKEVIDKWLEKLGKK